MITLSTAKKKALGKIEGLRRLLAWRRLTTNWRELWSKRRHKNGLPPIRFRSGEVLYHGPFDSPLLLLDEVWVNRWYEMNVALPTNGTMLDVGANVGSVSLYWASRVPSLQLHCYEPNPSAVETLRRNIKENHLEQRTIIHPEGVGRANGSLRLWVNVPTDLSTAYMEESPVEGGTRIDVPVVGIDEAWRRLDRKRIWLLKIDTEGAEVDILEGASSSFLAAVENAIVEYHDNIYPGSLTRCLKVLEQAGFDCQVRHHPWDEGIIYAERIG